MHNKKTIFILISLLTIVFLSGCVKETEYDNKEIISIYYYDTDGWGVLCNHKLYDFKELTYSEMPWDDGYEIKAHFTKEQAGTFFKNIKKHGIFLLDEFYKTDEIIDDGGTWHLIITFSDESTFKSGGYFKYPSQAKKLDKDFLALAGYKLFEIYS